MAAEGSDKIPARWKGAAAASKTAELERLMETKPYRGTVYVTILAKDKREARKALESVRSLDPYVRIDSTEGPEEIDLKEES